MFLISATPADDTSSSHRGHTGWSCPRAEVPFDRHRMMRNDGRQQNRRFTNEERELD